MEPMRIRAYLLDGRVAATEPYLPLDSILAAEWARKNYPEEFYNPPKPGQNEGWIIADLPFEKRGQGNRWYWACSFNQTRPVKEYIMHWNRRFDDQFEKYIDFQGKRGKVDSSSGRYKAYRMPLTVLLFPYLEWFAVGDIEAVRELCQGVAAIGKKPSQGLGFVKEWEVMPWHEDWSEIGPDGKLMRALYELPRGGKAIMRQYGMRPPYWRRENQGVVYCPY